MSNTVSDQLTTKQIHALREDLDKRWNKAKEDYYTIRLKMKQLVHEKRLHYNQLCAIQTELAESAPTEPLHTGDVVELYTPYWSSTKKTVTLMGVTLAATPCSCEKESHSDQCQPRNMAIRLRQNGDFSTCWSSNALGTSRIRRKITDKLILQRFNSALVKARLMGKLKADGSLVQN